MCGKGHNKRPARAGSVYLLVVLGLLLVGGPPNIGARLARAGQGRKRQRDGQGAVSNGSWEHVDATLAGGEGVADGAVGASEEQGAGAGAGGFLLPPHHHTGGAHQPERCVVVLGTGRSGSTSLVDALNQMPHFFVRMEQEGAYWYLYLAWRLLEKAYTHSRDFVASVRSVEATAGKTAAAHLSYRAAKGIYEQFATRKKQPWFNDLHPVRMREAIRAFYAITYGYHGPGVVSGFKEVRFVRGRAFSSESSTYDDFEDFINFLRLLCTDMKVLLNSRASASLEDNYKLESMLARNGVLKTTSNETFLRDLQLTHEWYDRYAEAHPDHALRVIMEDMFDPEVNGTLVRRLISFMGEPPDAYPHVVFNRMPTWSDPEEEASRSSSSSSSSKAAKPKKPKPREPWQLRRSAERRAALRRRRRLLELELARVEVELIADEEREEDDEEGYEEELEEEEDGDWEGAGLFGGAGFGAGVV
ncbi:hypothetical protein HYH02_003531 [Chlamydomonas schloesseri]|uniref:Sulfotransferase n=1 Tax=Chlamydomonas schloesseri TaxID=2026947 RepID=A0A835WPZ5_9CHLO|nr:hypothetical protein HYH02_003531 [Chlamydomonas schloesseri]|eukprot:KAG2451752.1 hypothetical protein HYH02_003531 [Chlamydomonas schloesseri]